MRIALVCITQQLIDIAPHNHKQQYVLFKVVPSAVGSNSTNHACA